MRRGEVGLWECEERGGGIGGGGGRGEVGLGEEEEKYM